MKTPTLLCYGEQGIGDELMFATMLADVKKDYRIVFDHHPRLTWLFQNAAWMHSEGHPITLHATRKNFEVDKGWKVEADAKVSIGNLGRFYRNDISKFQWNGPVYTAPAAEVAQYRAHLEKVARGRKIIGLATRGGTMNTARLYRMMTKDVCEQLFNDDRYLFVSLDYEDVTPLADWVTQKYGPGRFVWHPSIVWHWDYEHTAALIAATDAVVTVTQTVAHLSAAMGHPTYVMTPSRPDWRMGLTGETWNWYPSPNTRLLRQTDCATASGMSSGGGPQSIESSWQPALSRLFELLEARPLSEAA